METLDGIRSQLSELVEYAFREGYDACNEDVVKSMRECGFTSPEEAYQKGLDDAWECADKLNRMTIDEVRRVFDPFGLTIERESIFLCCTPNIAIAKIKAYEEQKKAEKEEVKVGDEVKINNSKYVVVRILNNRTFEGIGTGGMEEGLYLSACKKTGRSFPQIAEVLKQLQEGE